MNGQRHSSGPIALVGSGEYLPQMFEVDRSLMTTLGGPEQTHVVLLPTASALEPGMPQRWNMLGLAHFRLLSVEAVPLLVLRREDTYDPEILAQLHQANFFYFSGGNPHHIVETWRDTPAWDAVLERRHQGAVLAGCSAGAMMMGGVTVNIRRAASGSPEWIPAMGDLPNLAIMPHFDRLRTRFTGEQFAALLKSKPADVTVVGIDEDTALIRTGSDWTTLGQHGVSVFGADGVETRYSNGDKVSLP